MQIALAITLLLSTPLPDKQWTFLPIAGAVCANGSPTGFAISPAANSNTLLVFFQGGGACSDNESCHQAITSSYLDGYTQHDFENIPVERNLLENGWLFTSRSDPNNPFRDVNMAYVPYCTGDVHGGDNVVTYPGANAPTYHKGMRNTQAYFAELTTHMRGIDSVWLTGFSAGGFGAAFHRDTAAAAFKNAEVSILDDSGLGFANAPPHPSWNVQYPAGCPKCAEDFSTIMEYYATSAPRGRFALLSYTADSVLPLFFKQTPAQVAADLATFAERVEPLPNVAVFYVLGDNHVVMQMREQTSNNVSLADWTKQMVAGDANWRSVRP